MRPIIDELLRGKPRSAGIHILREFLQVHILYNISKSKYAKHLVFMGGTALRILYNTSRYSEDLDFDLWGIDFRKFVFPGLLEKIRLYFYHYNIECIYTYRHKEPVYRAFLKFKNLLYFYKLKPSPQDLLSIKLEIDVNPNPASKVQTSIINRYNLIFPILRRDLSSMMAGKICALFKRGYILGRDIYDLGWYLSKKIEPNYEYLARDLNIKNKEELVRALSRLVRKLDLKKLAAELRPFLTTEDGLLLCLHIPALIEDYSNL
jgi:hypothetical protein